jgi:hypothetical protein
MDPYSTALFVMQLFIVWDSLRTLANVHVYTLLFKRSGLYTETTDRLI